MNIFKLRWLAALWFACCISVAALAEDSAATNSTEVVSGKSYQIRNVRYGDLLRPKDANNANGTPLVLYSAEPWKCMTWRLDSAADATFTLKNHFTSKTFRAAGAPGGADPEGAAVVQIPWGKSPDERSHWRVTRLPGGAFKIIEAQSGQALSARKSMLGTARIVLAAWADDDSQKWQLIETDPATLTM